jgi:hypothetical protein
MEDEHPDTSSPAFASSFRRLLVFQTSLAFSRAPEILFFVFVQLRAWQVYACSTEKDLPQIQTLHHADGNSAILMLKVYCTVSNAQIESTSKWRGV